MMDNLFFLQAMLFLFLLISKKNIHLNIPSLKRYCQFAHEKHDCCLDLFAGLEKWLFWNHYATVRLAGNMPRHLTGAEVPHQCLSTGVRVAARPRVTLAGAVRLKRTPAQMWAQIQDRGKVKSSLSPHEGIFFLSRCFLCLSLSFCFSRSDSKREGWGQAGGEHLQSSQVLLRSCLSLDKECG